MTLFLRDPLLSFGNDIVDLREEADRSAAFLDRYVRRICTGNEAAFVREEPDLAQALWKLWALKESAFKAVNRRDRSRSFRYRELEVQPEFTEVLDRWTGRVFRAFVRSSTEFVMGVAWSGGPGSKADGSDMADPLLVSWVDRVDAREDLSRAVRFQVIRVLEQMEHEFHEEPIKRMTDAEGLLHPPVLDLPKGPAPVSLSHHGRLVMTTFHMSPDALPIIERGFPEREHVVSGRRIFLLAL